MGKTLYMYNFRGHALRTAFGITMLVMLLAGAGLVRAETPVFSDNFAINPDSTNLWNIYRNGDTSASWDLTKEVLYLTRVEGGAPAMFANYDLKDKHWAAEFRYKIGGGENSGADGIVFMFYKDEAPYKPDGVFPCGGGYMGFDPCDEISGEPSNSVGYGIEFDGWENYEYSDPSENHIALIDTTTSTHMASVDDPRTEDNLWHIARVEFDDGRVVVSVDNEKVLEHIISKPDYAYSGVGFSAGTGWANNNQVIDDFVLLKNTPPPPVPESSTIVLVSAGILGVVLIAGIYNRRR